MTRTRYVIYAIECNTPNCFACFEGDPGQPLGSVAQRARAKGWDVGRNATWPDHCPDHFEARP